jgi:5-methylcytosine-specific restriction protein B
MTLHPTAAEELVRLVRQQFPGWDSVSHPLFVADEIAYKRNAAAKVQALLDRQALATLLADGQYEEVISRFEQAGKAVVNLLYLSTPRTGDLQLLHDETIDHSLLAPALFDLIHGSGDQAARLERFLATSAAQGWPAKWTFSTYFPYLLNPADEVFIKPTVTRWFLENYTDGPAFPWQPDVSSYVAARAVFHQLRDALAPYGARDIIDARSVMYVAYSRDKLLKDALQTLRQALSDLEDNDELRRVRDSRDEVIGRYQPIFAPDHLPSLTAEAFTSFLSYKNNKHWTNIDRYASRVVKDMPSLRAALAILLDESQPLAERYTKSVGMISGVDKAAATPILLVSYPDRYGVWNGKSQAALEEMKLYPKLDAKATPGQEYAAVNDVLTYLAGALDLDLWTLDELWEVLALKAGALPTPFNAIFADREQAVWAFDFFRDTVELLGGGPEDERFALTLPRNRDMLRLNMGNWLVLDIADRGQVLHLATLVDPVMDTTYGPLWSGPYANTDPAYGVYELPLPAAQAWPDDVQAVYERSMAGIATRFADWVRSNLLEFHNDEIFRALFDDDARDRLLSDGLTEPIVPDPGTDGDPEPASTIAKEFPGFTPDAFAFLQELAQNNTTDWMASRKERWQSSVREPMRALVTDLGPHVRKAFNDYLRPDELEIRPDAHHTLARISKNWTATPNSQYHTYYWAAFYRKRLTKQTDAQLFINILSTYIRFGFFVGEQAEKIRTRFQERVLAQADAFMELINHPSLRLSTEFEFIRTDGTRQRMTAVRSVEHLHEWLENGDFDVLMPIPADRAVALGPALADHVLDAFRRAFPIYLLAVADDPWPAIERYLEAAFAGQDDDIDQDPAPTPYTTDDFLANTHLSQKQLDDLLALVADRPQLIFTGPPGTGKTFVARELGKLLTGLAEPPTDRLELIQFHPAYSYEEFIEGIRPKSTKTDNGQIIEYPVRPGAFREFCERAATIDGPCVFIIDEINRGNIARIFGELMLLLEYRKLDVPLPYSGARFAIPPNVVVIGTMNTADRSIALVDFALRRRFHFVTFPADPALFDRWLAAHPTGVPYLGALYRHLAREAIEDRHYAIGFSYFMKPNLTEAQLELIWRYSILPQLQEYYIEESDKAKAWEWHGDILRAIRNDE